jgi:hypothetical protein
MVLRRGTRPKRRRTEAGRTKAGREADTRRKGYGANTKKEERNGAEQNGAREPKRRRTEPDGVEGKQPPHHTTTTVGYMRESYVWIVWESFSQICLYSRERSESFLERGCERCFSFWLSLRLKLFEWRHNTFQECDILHRSIQPYCTISSLVSQFSALKVN